MTPQSSAAADMTIAEVARALKTTSINVLLFIKRGLLVGREERGRWLVDSGSFAAFQRIAAGQARRAPCRSACSRAGSCGKCE